MTRGIFRKRHYRKVAAAIAEVREHRPAYDEDTIQAVERALSRMFDVDNETKWRYWRDEGPLDDQHNHHR